MEKKIKSNEPKVNTRPLIPRCFEAGDNGIINFIYGHISPPIEMKRKDKKSQYVPLASLAKKARKF